jgi:RNA polymerase sigma factor (sigma-70 family)
MPPPAEGLASRLFLVPALRAQPDPRLVALVREGYEAAFEEIVRRYDGPLRRYAASIVGGRSEDVLQDAFSKALPALCRDEAQIDLRPWLFRIVRNTALNELRDNPPSPELLAETIGGSGNPAEELERREQLAELIRRLRALPERPRAAIVMRELEGLGHAEIAAALGLSDGAARQAIYRARQALRNAAGLALPVPLLKALMGGAGPASAELASGAGTAGIGAGGAAGAGVALKATAATVLVAGAVGAGAALQDGAPAGTSRADSPPARRQVEPPAAQSSPLLASDEDGGSDGSRGPGGDGTGHPAGERDEGGESSGQGPGSRRGPGPSSGQGPHGSSQRDPGDDGSHAGHGEGTAGDRSGRGGGDSSGGGSGADSSSSGPGGDDSGLSAGAGAGDGSDSSGSGSGEESSGPGGGNVEELEESSSGEGSGSGIQSSSGEAPPPAESGSGSPDRAIRVIPAAAMGCPAS